MLGRCKPDWRVRADSILGIETSVTPRVGNTAEVVLNAEVAALLRRRGLEAESEQSLQVGGRRHQVDVLVELGDYAIAIEAEFAPARTVRADAEKRLPKAPLLWRGLTVDFVFALVYPAHLKGIPESEAKEQLATCDSLEFTSVFRSESAGVSEDVRDHILGTRHRGSVLTLAEYLHDFWIRRAKGGSVEATVSQASTAIERASEILRRAPRPHPFAAVDGDPESTSALMWLNALLFQELLSEHLDATLLPPGFRDTGIPKPDPAGHPGVLLAQWERILQINWWPIFHVAREALKSAPTRQASLALEGLVEAATDIASKGVIRRHDIAGRIFHRLLGTRKFLATNYTTIPAAILLAGLAFDRDHPMWKETDWTSLGDTKKLRIVDPACGSGTLLMAALQEILKLYRRAGGTANGQGDMIRTLLEKVVHGYDVVPAAVHLTAATLSMAEMRQIIGNMPLYWMPHDVRDGKARMGSLDFLLGSPNRGAAQFLPLFVAEGRDPGRMTGEGERIYDAVMPSDCNLVIGNPPYTRAGGPGTTENSDWNPIFGSALSKSDGGVMKDALRRTLAGTPASLYAGLGSAFVVLACERVRVGGRVALVLPATVLTGSRWAPVRDMLLDEFDVEWVVASHDRRHRVAKGDLPGRLFVAFSESTRMAETLIVATKKRKSDSRRDCVTRFVNLRRNPDEAIDAMAIARSLLEIRRQTGSLQSSEITIGDDAWGEVLFVEQSRLSGSPWVQSTFSQGRLAETALELAEDGILRVGGRTLRIPIAKLSSACELGPYEMQIKNPTQGLFDIVETDDPTRVGHPAIWHHSSKRIGSLEAVANARLRERSGRDPNAQAAMLAKAGRLHLARELRHAPQRLAAVLTDEAMLGVRSWITLLPKQSAQGKDEALCLWLNSTPGVLLRILCSNRPYLGRSALPHEIARDLPVIDIDALSLAQRDAAHTLFEDMKGRQLQGFAQLAEDDVRRELDRRLFEEVLGCEAGAALDGLARILNREPTMTTRH